LNRFFIYFHDKLLFLQHELFLQERTPQFMPLRLWAVELDLRQLLPTKNNNFHAKKEIHCLQTDGPVLEVLQHLIVTWLRIWTYSIPRHLTL